MSGEAKSKVDIDLEKPGQRQVISLEALAANVRSKTLARRLEAVDKNKDGVIEAEEIGAVVEDLVREEHFKKIYRFVAIAMMVVVVILIGALTGITFAIVQMAKDTKVTNLSSGNFQVMTTKDDKLALTGGATLDVHGKLTFLPPAQRPNFTEAALGGGRRRRLNVVDDKLVELKDYLEYYGTLPFQTIEQGCDLINYGLSTFLVSAPNMNNQLIIGGQTALTVVVVEENGCKNLAGKDVTALVTINDQNFIILCNADEGACHMRRRLNVVDDKLVELKDYLEYYGTLPFQTIEQGCDLINYGLSTFLVSAPNMNNQLIIGGQTALTVVVVEENGCKNLAGKDVTALVTINDQNFIILCNADEGACHM
ncbi:hypothetical protein GPECTOR_15g456 [Gonium pectorale]|uniref:EF-hand domain-containing protein n=1 Tax=Gonium pectorale TaxID=33097 RepID=A0A150GLV3_GONPE|nr:hypothetical protein GPECTOR_15g456 [Gonium pectorale]|eukprot:KXZ50771.1 hypothetical protein GPECTOR_15g456 [Gonium pectorale]